MKYILGNLIQLADQGNFDVIIHGCNAFTTMGGGSFISKLVNIYLSITNEPNRIYNRM